MEIEFDNMSYKNTMFSLENITLSLKSGAIYGFIGDYVNVLGDILTVNKRPSSGSVSFLDYVIKRSNSIRDKDEIRKHIGYVPFERDFAFNESTVREEIRETYKKLRNVDILEKHILDSLKIVGLNDKFLERNPELVSYNEQKCVKLACVLSYNPEVLILDNFFYGFTNREIDYFRKLFLKLKNKFKKTIIFIDTKVDFMTGLTDSLFIFKDGKMVLEGEKELFYNNDLYKYVDQPKIVELTNYILDSGYDINKYLECNEFIKEVFRYIKY